MDGEKVSPTSQLLLEYEKHLRSTLAKGLDAESCSLHTFEAMLSQSMENLGKYFYVFEKHHGKTPNIIDFKLNFSA